LNVTERDILDTITPRILIVSITGAKGFNVGDTVGERVGSPAIGVGNNVAIILGARLERGLLVDRNVGSLVVIEVLDCENDDSTVCWKEGSLVL